MLKLKDEKSVEYLERDSFKNIRYHIKEILHELHLLHQEDEAILLNKFVKKILKTEIIIP